MYNYTFFINKNNWLTENVEIFCTSIGEVSGHSVIYLTLFFSMHFETYLKKIEILRFTRCKRRKGGKRYIGIRDIYERDMCTAKSIKKNLFWTIWAINVCLIKICSKHSSNTLLHLL